MKKDSCIFLEDIALMRPILILCIICGHAFAIYTGTNYWPLPEGCNQNILLSWINPCLISFALQAFVFVSGYLFAYKSDKLKLLDCQKFIFSKLKRIYLPSIIFSALYVFMFPQIYSRNIIVLYDIFNGAGHLWFLPMLFWCYVFGWFALKIKIRYTLRLAIFLLMASYFSSIIPNVFRISTAIHYFIYFVLGMWTFENKRYIINCIKRKRWRFYFIWLFVVFLCCLKVFLYSRYCTIPLYPLFILKVTLNIFLGIAGSVVLFCTANLIVSKYGICVAHNDIWYGMYIYHQFIMMWLYYRSGISFYLHGFTPWVVLLLTLIISYCLVSITLKGRVGRWLIG